MGTEKCDHQGHTSLFGELNGVAVVHCVRGHQADAAVPVDSVVPTEEELAVCTSVFDRTEARREVRPIFQGFELRFGVRIVIRDMRPAVRFADIEVHEQRGNGFRAHAAAAVGVQRERAGDDALFVSRIGDDLFGELGRFPRGDHPADDIAAEDIEDDVQVIMPHAA